MDIQDYMNRLPRPEKTYAEKESTMFYVYVFNLVMDELMTRKLTNRRAINYVLSYTTYGNKTRAYQETHPMASKRTANVNANKYSKRFDVYVAQSMSIHLVYKGRLALALAVKYINVNGIERYVNKLILELWKGD
ncbi:hypothetical protein EFN63_07370 [Leuconostoc citreum]|uniref:hypothetical protein n=1 Tax=Leuconostoc TaxID=1243 RepID=UPI000A1DC27D|nr:MULTISPECIES: hypothetical protein [Leuconostoc]MBU7451331.1 hypothetical protein [Leuconostoc citreum]MCT3068178.1 hypothetical protein [Leuconostoc citreum]OSP81327.1 hypothetical protein B9J75_07875 [Leuconostoc citreum]TDG64650.1 hypothetical protein C5L21_000468 [Leuconostoc citreum]TDG64737.1 hypothetical protein C5L21_000307 [Leuconostoc citreum]